MTLALNARRPPHERSRVTEGGVSLNRWAVKRDKAERPIVEALEAADYEVWIRDEPDLMVRKSNWPPGIFMGLEVKTGKARIRKSQPGQAEFIATTGVPIVRVPYEALAVLREFEAMLI
jgi:hypothetical protein